MVLHEIGQNPDDGELTVRPIPRMSRFFEKEQPALPWELWDAEWDEKEGRLAAQNMGSALVPVPEDAFYADIRFRLEEASELGIVLHSENGLESGCFLKMKPSMKMMAMDRWPRCSTPGRYQWQINGDCAFAVDTIRPLPEGPEYRIRVFREDDICVIYVYDCVALSTRIYDHRGKSAGIYLVQGSVSGLSMNVYRNE
jgi:beta-fructofuranosidase